MLFDIRGKVSCVVSGFRQVGRATCRPCFLERGVYNSLLSSFPKIISTIVLSSKEEKNILHHLLAVRLYYKSTHYHSTLHCFRLSQLNSNSKPLTNSLLTYSRSLNNIVRMSLLRKPWDAMQNIKSVDSSLICWYPINANYHAAN